MAGLFITLWAIGMLASEGAAVFAIVYAATRLAIRHEGRLTH